MKPINFFIKRGNNPIIEVVFTEDPNRFLDLARKYLWKIINVDETNKPVIKITYKLPP